MTPSDNTGQSKLPSTNSQNPAPPPLAERLPDAEPVKPIRGSHPTPSAKTAQASRQKATPEQIAAAEKHMGQANLLRIRGELKQSLTELVKAMEANPFDPAPHLLSADMLRNVGRPDEAIAALERAIELSPDTSSRSIAEAKLARLVVEQDQAEHIGSSVNEHGATPIMRGRASIGIASAIVPGLGQLLAGHTVKAAVFFGSWATFALGSVSLMQHTHGLARLGMVSIGGAALIWLISLIDALNEGRG